MVFWGALGRGKEGVGKPTPFMALCHVGWALAELYMALAMAPSKELCERAVTLCHQLRNRAPRHAAPQSDTPVCQSLWLCRGALCEQAQSAAASMEVPTIVKHFLTQFWFHFRGLGGVLGMSFWRRLGGPL